jgi:hypothetical protein
VRVAKLATRAAALLLVASLVLIAGPLAGALAAAWGVATLVVAWVGVRRLLARGAAWFEPAALAMDAGLAYLPVSALWAFVYRSDTAFAGFSGTAALLTAAHFQYAGFGACVLVGALGARLGAAAGPTFRVTALSTALAVALVAAGITLSHVIEVVSAWLLVGSVVLVAYALVRASASMRGMARALLVLSAASAVLAASFAAHFATFGFARLDAELFVRMLRFHGAVNALGFVTAGLAGLAPGRNG